ncbi:16S rRNA (uracil(1498)-N(3))-methyltransferase [Galbibacter sp. EGI 63066]|uniref:16S rRNA (uracil(1498)-N(3))-methyltransferase n=1 Tax=Galbibacter sp. EGI 63066 TaxID=2993559 RepID=UPI0022498BE3|nr:16S rRNA (uracil(1498)-N(3))-methyltransferase [Galbibacter sp. EGI 63066]MCX2680854.1 16S rRNA (uracil(1498)-N(3))-methyltransferase [Galbibacter sp. EGI 63066]
MQLFYAPDIEQPPQQYAFDKEESRHISKVLRKKEGDTLFITNGRGWLFKAEIIQADIKHCTVSIVSSEMKPKRDYHLHMAVAPTKMNDRYEWFLEKATEIGIDEITPIICDHSERKVIKPERYEKILQSAMKQSLQCYLPKLNEAVQLSTFLTENKFDGRLFIAHCEEEEKASLKDRVKAAEDTLILIGPEGDFSTKEIELALQQGFIPISLGENRLRTETAAIVACHSIGFTNEK